MINNVIPYIVCHSGKWWTSLFSTEAITTSVKNMRDTEKYDEIGVYHEEFEFAAEDDPNLTAAILLF